MPDVNGILIRHPYVDPRQSSYPVHFEGPGRAKQAMKDECDINNIVARYRERGILNHVAKHEGRYDDLLGAVDYQTAMQAVAQAQEAFDTLPAKLRARFENDPSKFLAFVENEENLDEMISLGLVQLDRRALNERERTKEKAASEAAVEPPSDAGGGSDS
jgi:phage internal scaffolding protein